MSAGNGKAVLTLRVNTNKINIHKFYDKIFILKCLYISSNSNK